MKSRRLFSNVLMAICYSIVGLTAECIAQSSSPTANKSFPAASPEATVAQYLQDAFADSADVLASLYFPADLTEFKALFQDAFTRDTTNYEVKQMFSSLRSLSDVDTMPPTSVFALFWKTLNKRFQLSSMLTGAKHSIIGHLDESDTITNVLVRNFLTVGDREYSIVDVISLKRLGSKWYLLLGDKLKLTVANIRRSR